MLYIFPAILGLLALWQLCICIGRASNLTQYSFWLFVVYFFVIAPVFQIYSDKFPWGWQPSTTDIVAAQFLVLAFCFSYIIGTIPWAKRQQPGEAIDRSDAPKFVQLPTAPQATRVLLAAASVYVSALVVLGFDARGFFSTREEFDLLLEVVVGQAGATPVLMIVLALVRVPAVVLVLYAMLVFEQRKQFRPLVHARWYHLGAVTLVVLVGVLPNSPMVAARFWAGALLTVVLFWTAAMLGRRILQLAMLTYGIGVILLFTLANLFRREGTQIELGVSEFSTGHFDAFIQIVNSVRYVGDEGVDFGRQLFGAVFYWVPRSAWPGKPTGTGHLLHEYLGHPFTNVSGPAIAEAYVAIGVVGVLLMGIVLGVISRNLEAAREGGIRSGVPAPLYLGSWFFVAYQWILLRGDMMTFLKYLFPLLVFLVGFELIIRSAKPLRLRLIKVIAPQSKTGLSSGSSRIG